MGQTEVVDYIKNLACDIQWVGEVYANWVAQIWRGRSETKLDTRGHWAGGYSWWWWY